ncbi:MAG: hypothetical protein CMH54_05695, partial [Myxococcales bacterium]|nr:hypothetical protein [Myxococcales bacterium]
MTLFGLACSGSPTSYMNGDPGNAFQRWDGGTDASSQESLQSATDIGASDETTSESIPLEDLVVTEEIVPTPADDAEMASSDFPGQLT